MPLLTLYQELKTWLRNINKVIIIDNTNINSFPNKFEQFKELVMKDIDVLVIIIVIRTERWKHGPYNASHSICCTFMGGRCL